MCPIKNKGAPQYKWLKNSSNWQGDQSTGNFYLVLDNKQQKKLIFYTTSAVIDFPFSYKIVVADAKSRVIIVKDSTANSYGVVSTDGKVLVPCNNYGIALADIHASVFFVQHDKPYNPDTNTIKNPTIFVIQNSLNAEDKDWLMYNADGKLIIEIGFSFY